MKELIDILLKKEKKPVEKEKLYKKVEEIEKKKIPDYKISDVVKNAIDEALDEGINKYEYYMTPTGKYTLLSKTSFRKGRFHGNRAMEGFVVSNTVYINKEGSRIVREEKYSINREDCNNAIDGDYVLIDIGGKKPKVEKILNRNIGNVIGVVTRIGNMYYLKPIDKKKQGLSIALNEDVSVGEIVSVSLEEEKEDNCYIGKVVRKFVNSDNSNSDALFEAFKCGMPEGFSKESLKQLESIPDVVLERDLKNREDFTNWEVFSIDCSDTKDKDDCISLQILDNGNYQLGVHIADVAYYVPYNSPIDKDAFRKGTSYYFGGLVEPALPEKLSNGICSLNEGVLRLTKSVIMEYDKNGNIVDRRITRGYIKSRKSLTYESVNSLLNNKVKEESCMGLENTLENMRELAYIFRKNRLLGGAIIFNRPELRFKHDNERNPYEINLRYEDTAETIIQEFMLQANVNVSEILTENEIPCIYRVHGLPCEERLRDFLGLLNIVNIPFSYNVKEILEDKELLQLLNVHINKSPDLRSMLNTSLIRCMSHASYSPNNIGHYGTGFDEYTHFTSPIRRLTDLTISRILDECYFETNPYIKAQNIKRWSNLIGDYATQASKMERIAEDVEKEVLYMDSAKYMSNYIGCEFEGTVINISNNGIGIQLDNLLEGKVRNRNLEGNYVCNPETFTLLSLDNNINYYIGDRLKLRLESSDKDTKQIDFKVLKKIKENVIKDSKNSNQYIIKKAKQIA